MLMENDKRQQDMPQVSKVSEPSALYYGASPRLRASGILEELPNLNEDDTIWLIEFMEKQLANMSENSAESEIDPLYGLDYLRGIHAGMPSFEELKAEYLAGKYEV